MKIFWRKFRDAGASEGGGGDPTAIVLKAIEGMKAGMMTKEQVDTATALQIKAAVDPMAASLADIDKTVKALNEKAGQIGQPNFTKGVGELFFDGIATNIKGETLTKFNIGTPQSVHRALKAVGTMTVADDLLAGSAVTTYDLTLNQIPNRLVNFRSLVRITPLGTGIFQFPRERTPEGAIAFQTAGQKKSIINARFEMITVNAEYLAGLAPVAKQMMQDLPYLQGFMPTFMLREYLFQEDSTFYASLAAAATGSRIIPGAPTSDIEQIMGWVTNLRTTNYEASGIVINPADVYKIFVNKGATSGDYTLPPGVVLSNTGAISIFGIPVFQTTFIPAGKVLVGDWNRVTIGQTDGLSVSTDDRGDNFDNNTVTWKVEARVVLAVLQPAAFIWGDLNSVT